MIYLNLSLRHFRNIADLDIELNKKLNIFIGENGQGKTNLLESLILLTSGESFRYGSYENFISKNHNQSYLKTQIVENNLDYLVSLELNKNSKSHFLNKKKISTTKLSEYFKAILFSPESLSAIKEGDEQRRNLIDEALILFDARNAGLISDFKKALKTRNKILKNHLEGLSSEKETWDLLASINATYFVLATQLTWARIQLIKNLLEDFNKIMRSIVIENVDILVEYTFSDENIIDFSFEKLKEKFKNRLSELSGIELKTGVSLVGPQKHDVTFLYNGNDSRFYCSQGQQRALILAFKMAQIVYHRRVHGVYPVLMLDDVLSELDERKRTALIEFLSQIDSQIFITTTDINIPSQMKSNEMAIFKIANGHVIERSLL